MTTSKLNVVPMKFISAWMFPTPVGYPKGEDGLKYGKITGPQGYLKANILYFNAVPL